MNIVYINDTDGLKRLGGNKAIYGRLLKRFTNDVGKYDVIKCISDGEIESAKGHAHTVKGMAANLSLEAVYNESAKIEAALKGGTVTPEIAESYRKILSETVEAINKYLG